MDKPWKVILAFLGVFIAGAVFGGFFSLGVGRRILEMEGLPTAKAALPAAPQTSAAVATTQKPPPPALPPSVQSAQLLRRVANQLDLTPAQKAQITPIIQRSLQDIWRQQQSLYRETTFITQRMKQDIAKELTPEQQTRLDDLWRKAIEQFRKRQAEAQEHVKGQPAQKSANGGPVATPERPAAGGTVKPSGSEAKVPAPPVAGEKR